MFENYTKAVLFKNDIETLGFFSEQMAKTLTAMGYEVYIFDFLDEYKSFMDITWFIESGRTLMITFNFTGICGEDIFLEENGRTIWDNREIPCINIVVDHPFYYHEHLKLKPKHYVQFCIDQHHVTYMDRYFKEIVPVSFLPLGGTQVADDFISFERRDFDIVLTGNYTPTEKFEPFISRINQEYTDFYHGIIDDLIANPYKTIEFANEEHIRKEIPNISEEEIKDCMKNMVFIDLYVRFYFRALAVKNLVDSGLKVHVFGAGWELLDCIHKENLIQGGPVNSLECLQHISNSRISLNVMPWFKAGAHDRIFNSMLNKSICLSDSSSYIDEQFTDGTDIALYSLADMDALPDIAKDLLHNTEKARMIAENGYQKAKAFHTWDSRTRSLLQFLNEYSSVNSSIL